MGYAAGGEDVQAALGDQQVRGGWMRCTSSPRRPRRALDAQGALGDQGVVQATSVEPQEALGDGQGAPGDFQWVFGCQVMNQCSYGCPLPPIRGGG